MKRSIYTFLAIFAVLTSCRDDAEYFESTTTTGGFEPAAIFVNSSVSGQVLSESGQPVAGALVKLGQQQVESASNGFFAFENVPMNTRGAYIHVEHPGYWHASRKVVPHLNGQHYTTLTLAPAQHSHSIQAPQGGEVTLSDGLRITFPPAAFAYSDGTLYNGEVLVAARSHDPLSPHTNHVMPSVPHGIDSEQKETVISIFGMAAVDFIGSSGEPLRIAGGVKALVELPIPDMLAGAAPSALPMWHFDETSGYWREEGMAQRQGNTYQGEVSHFSFWSVGDGFDTVMLQGTLVNDAGEPVANTQVTVQFPAQNTAATTFTDANGFFAGLVPTGEPLNLMVSDDCNFGVYGQAIPPLSADTDLGTITVPENELATTAISGVLLGCDGNPATNALVQVCWPQGCQFLLSGLDGSFGQTFSWCGTQEFSIDIVDYTTGFTVSLTENAAAELSLGTITVCDAPLSVFMSLSVDVYNQVYPNPFQYIQGDRVFLKAEASQYSFTLSFPDNGAGTYQNADVSLNYFDYSVEPNIPLFLLQGSCFQGECTNLTITITEYGPVGGWIEGTYNGTVDFTTSTQNLPNSPVSGAFRVPRTS